MLGKRQKATQEKIDGWFLNVKTSLRNLFLRNQRRILSLLILFVIFFGGFIFVINDMEFEQFKYFKKITPKSLNRLSEDSFRKIIDYGWEEKIYIGDTAIIRSRLEADSMIFGGVKFNVKLIPTELEVEFVEASPLFAITLGESDSSLKVYSDKGKLYPYSVNTTDLPIIDAKNFEDRELAKEFLINMRKNDRLLYSRVSQLIPNIAERQITVFFNDVDFKTVFSTDSKNWKDAFRHYRQLTRNMQVLDINSVATMDLRFKNLAYTIEKEGRN